MFALLDMQSISALSDRGQSFFRSVLAPVRGDQAHPGDALHRAHDVYAAADLPPALPRFLHEAEAFQPPSLRERRRVAAEAPAVQLEAEQRQPVLEPQQSDESAAARILLALPTERAYRAPQG